MSKYEAENYSTTDSDSLPVIIELDYSSGSSGSEADDTGDFGVIEGDSLPVDIELDYSSGSSDI